MREEFTTKKVGGEGTVGEILFKARRGSGDSLDRVADKLQIQKKYLHSLEESEYENLPADVYTRGFLKSYARYLKLDEEKVLELYQRERNIIDNIQIKQEQPEQKNNYKKPSVIVTPRLVKILIVILAIFGLFFYLWYQISGLSSAPKLDIIEPMTDKTIVEDTVIIIGSTKPGADVAINGQSVYVDAEGNFKETVGLQVGVNTLRIVAVNKLGKENVVERKVIVEREGDIAIIEEKKENELELIVTIKDEATWISVKEDDKEIYTGTMLPDSSQTFTAKESITLSSGNDSTTYIKFNGEEIGAIGDTGEAIRDMRFTENVSL